MATVTGQPSGVFCRNHLRKSAWFGAVGLMTTGAHHRRIQLLGLNRTGILCVLGLGSMAGLASHDYMFALLLLIHHVGVTGLASLMTGKGNRPGGYFGDRITAVVPVLPKTARYERDSQDHKRDHSNYHDGREPDKVFCVFESLHEWTSSSRIRLNNDCLGAQLPGHLQAKSNLVIITGMSCRDDD